MKTLRERSIATFGSIVIGDAAGESVEGLPSSTIIDGRAVQLASAWGVFPDFAQIEEILALKRRIWNDATSAGVAPAWTSFIPNRPPFVTTDDTFLNGLVAESMIRMRGWNLVDQIHTHISGLGGRDDAWGPTIRAGVEELRDNRRAFGEPARRGARLGTGNGPMMRSVSLGVWQALAGAGSTDQLLNNCFELGLMSHWDIRASIAAFAYARYLELLLRCEYVPTGSDAKALLDKVYQEVVEAEQIATERYPDNQPADQVTISGRIGDLAGANIQSYEDVAALWGTEGNSLITAPYVLGMMTQALVMGGKEPHFSLIATVHAGGDTDTNAALLGALLGACFGWDAFPSNWINYPPIQTDMSVICDLAEGLYAASSPSS